MQLGCVLLVIKGINWSLIYSLLIYSSNRRDSKEKSSFPELLLLYVMSEIPGIME
jgi:hypothetical protein